MAMSTHADTRYQPTRRCEGTCDHPCDCTNAGSRFESDPDCRRPFSATKSELLEEGRVRRCSFTMEDLTWTGRDNLSSFLAFNTLINHGLIQGLATCVRGRDDQRAETQLNARWTVSHRLQISRHHRALRLRQAAVRHGRAGRTSRLRSPWLCVSHDACPCATLTAFTDGSETRYRADSADASFSVSA
ncbi:hypothetical protein OH76DRAFT_506295 [Lentinus brumalis]|uniref:Uncharacterized protein n=1 Tax=Lentinus brumalis TaxID=2498619 RepID=A0A371DAX7_9APHY|nr:hypothetical protein OH76DRAFT_506295 [Polyporus brumalis]